MASVRVLTTGTVAALVAVSMSSVALLIDTEVPVAEGTLPLQWIDMRVLPAVGTVTHWGHVSWAVPHDAVAQVACSPRDCQ
jgi:hypothetical protein